MKSVPRLLAVLFALAVFSVAGRAAGPGPLLLGSAWYPEQWPEERWDADLKLMADAGMHMARIGEFAWSSMEPEEGRYTLDWVERAINAAARHNIVVVLGTPSDAPPAWLTSKYPETLRVTEAGVQIRHGFRRQFNYTSPKYLELSRRIAEELARRFGHHPNVIGWQIGNEYTEDSFDPHSRQLWHQWLQRKYGTLDQLNHHWMTAYWSQTYSAWDQIPMETGRSNPGLLLDYKRFVTEQWVHLQRNQLEVIRAHADPRQWITTNLGGLGWANRFNRTDIAADLDFISWDTYVGQGHLNPTRIGATHDLVRGWKRKNFWVMEIQPGFVDWAGIANSLDKGETRAAVWEAVGHGADAVAFWQWRAALNGQEQYHGVLVGPDGEPVPFYEEARQLGAEFARVGPALAGTSPESQVAILHDYDSRWAIDFHLHSKRYDQIETLLGYYAALRELTQSVDIIDPRGGLEGYKLVVAPNLNVVSPEMARRLEQYVRGGGHLLLGPRSGLMNEYNALSTLGQPGLLRDLVGAKVEQFYALLDDVPVSGRWGDGRATIWAEYLRPLAPDATVTLTYGRANGWLDGKPAMVSRKLGKGTISYLGALLEPAMMQRAARDLVQAASVNSPTIPVPAGVEVCRRVGQGREVFVVINHNPKPVVLDLPVGCSDLLRPSAQERIELPQYDVAVLQRNPAKPN
ncbi:beta-galactosidase [Opitutus sp. ER46]|uniref:beta-galactosidase n=1 Tax=Opitutus sp. ER46 TaxID=2161864 RepID=UPI000D3028EA|nr:beta-galactosidase [Opitutus sp. ER46]PTX99085.1 beta-galactosidase [Opitutus sp. ER46]